MLERPMPAAKIPPPPDIRWHRPVQHRRVITRDLANNKVSLQHHRDEGAFEIVEHGMRVDSAGIEEHEICSDDPLSAKGHVRWQLGLQRDDWNPVVVCEIEQTSDLQHFHVSVDVQATLNDEVVFARRTTHAIARRFV